MIIGDVMQNQITFPEWVKELEGAGRTKQQIASDLSITVTSLYRYLCGDRIPDKRVMLRIGELSKERVNMLWFFTAAKPSPVPPQKVAS